MSTEIEITDNSEELLEALAEASDRALIAVGMEAESNAKHECTAVDTGRLRNSITYATSNANSGVTYRYSDNNGVSYSQDIGTVDSEDVVIIGTNVEYAIPIELGNHMRSGIHFLKNAIVKYSKRYLEIIKADMQSE